jgi:hypothetical protein
VDHVGLGLRDYLTIISTPMDLQTVRGKLENGAYQRFCEFNMDVCLIWENCKTYNMEGSSIYTFAIKNEKYHTAIIRPIRERGIPLTEVSKIKFRIDGSEVQLDSFLDTN